MALEIWRRKGALLQKSNYGELEKYGEGDRRWKPKEVSVHMESHPGKGLQKNGRGVR